MRKGTINTVKINYYGELAEQEVAIVDSTLVKGLFSPNEKGLLPAISWLFGRLAPLAKAVIFPRSFVRIVILLSKSPTGMAESTIPVNTTLCDILILLSKYYSSSLYPKFLIRKSLSLQSFFTLTHSFRFTLQSSSLSIVRFRQAA